MTADTFLERLCSLVPRPRTNQVLERHRPRNATFCELMKHGLAVNVLACPCGHRMRYVATIFDRKGLARLLRAKGLPHQIEPILPAPGPPQRDFDFGPRPPRCEGRAPGHRCARSKPTGAKTPREALITSVSTPSLTPRATQ